MKFSPGDWVQIVFAQVNYRGRVSRCHLNPGNEWTYTVDYIDDGGNFKGGDFRGDEIEKAPA